MVSRNTLIKASTNFLNKTDGNQILKASHAFIKMIVQPEMVEELVKSAKGFKATPFVTQKCYELMLADSGTATMKTNFLALLEHQNKQLTYPYNDLINLMSHNNKLHFSEYLKNEQLPGAPARAFIEFVLLHDLAKSTYIKTIKYLGDRETIPNRKDNPNRDYLVTFDTDVVRDYDVKTKAFSKKDDYSHGDIRRIDISSKGEIITYPRDYSGVGTECHSVLDNIKKAISLSKFNLTARDRTQVLYQIDNMEQILIKKEDPAAMLHAFQEASLQIARLPSWGKPINMYLPYKIQDHDLTKEQMAYLNSKVHEIPHNLLDKPSYMTAWMKNQLLCYSEINPNTIKALKPLEKIFPVIKGFIKEAGETTIYLGT